MSNLRINGVQHDDGAPLLINNVQAMNVSVNGSNIVWQNSLALSLNKQSTKKDGWSLRDFIDANNKKGIGTVVVTNDIVQPSMKTGDLSGLTVTLINNGEIQGNTEGMWAMTLQSEIKLVNNGYIRGAGGHGGDGGTGRKGNNGIIYSGGRGGEGGKGGYGAHFENIDATKGLPGSPGHQSGERDSSRWKSSNDEERIPEDRRGLHGKPGYPGGKGGDGGSWGIDGKKGERGDGYGDYGLDGSKAGAGIIGKNFLTIDSKIGTIDGQIK